MTPLSLGKHAIHMVSGIKMVTSAMHNYKNSRVYALNSFPNLDAPTFISMALELIEVLIPIESIGNLENPVGQI